MSGSSLRPFQMSGSGRETLSNIWEALSDVWECSESPPRYPVSPLGCQGVVGRLSWMSESGREALLDDREWSGDPSE